jgi:hypothetical protein
VKTFGFEMTGRIVVWVGGNGPIARADWDAYIPALKEHAKKFPTMCVFVDAGSGAPTALQRKQLTDIFPASCRQTVMIQDAVQRGVVTALSWFTPAIKVLAPGEEPAAFEHLGLSSSEQAAVTACYGRLLAEMGRAHAARRTA